MFELIKRKHKFFKKYTTIILNRKIKRNMNGWKKVASIKPYTLTVKDLNASSRILTLHSGKVIDVVIPGLVEPFFASRDLRIFHLYEHASETFRADNALSGL